MASCQKLAIILENKEIEKLMLSKNVLLYSYSSMKKKFRKIHLIFDGENSNSNSKFNDFISLQITFPERSEIYFGVHYVFKDKKLMKLE